MSRAVETLLLLLTVLLVGCAAPDVKHDDLRPATTRLCRPEVHFNYDVAGCLLDEVEFHLVGVYHSDGQTYGPGPGYVHHAEVQFGVQKPVRYSAKERQ